MNGIYLLQAVATCLTLVGVLLHANCAGAEEPVSRSTLEQRLAAYYAPPKEFVGDSGNYRSPLSLADGRRVQSASQWQLRRAEILTSWHRRLGAWPPLLDKPTVERLQSIERDGYLQHQVRVQISATGQMVDGYILMPLRNGPFPAVLVPFYEPLTSIGEGKRDRARMTTDCNSCGVVS